MKSHSLILEKQNFKFSAGHFLIFDKNRAERLHGHNYQVKVRIGLPKNQEWKNDGYFVDFQELKAIIKTRLDQWDEVVLLPQLNKEMKFQELPKDLLEVKFRDRYYVFPKNEVVLVPVSNTSVEQLSDLLAKDLFELFKVYKISELEVIVEETQGQGARTVVR